MKKTVFFMAFAAVSLTYGLTACSSEDDGGKTSGKGNVPSGTRVIELTEKQKEAVKKNNDFAFNIYRSVNNLEKLKGKSYMISPLSITYALGMLNNGATGQTSQEIQALLGFGDSDAAAINELCAHLIKEMPKVDEYVDLGIANLMAIDKSCELEKQYRESLNLFYDAEVASLPFGTQEAVDYVNNWCSEHTNGMIPKITDDLSGTMALLNGVYFNASWTEPFESENTKNEEFEKEDGSKVSLPMMNGKNPLASYAKGDNYQALRLPYGTNDNWALYVLLPNTGSTTDDVITGLTDASWTKTLQNMRTQETNVKLPRFKIKAELQLGDIIAGMGASSMFQNRQELSRICSNNKDLCVDVIKQNVAIDVNEDGTTAAAVTIVKMYISNLIMPEYIDFYATRPFVYLIQEASSGAIFFIGTYRGEVE